MIRMDPAFWLLLAASAAFATFAVKYEVQGLADQLAETTKTTVAQERELRILNAEWAYLSRPDTIAQMNQRFLSLAPITAKQLRATIADVPMRPPLTPPMLVTSAPVIPPPAAAPRPVTAADASLEISLPVMPASFEQPAIVSEAAKPPTRVVATSHLGLRPTARPTNATPLDGKSLDQLIQRVASGQ
jgi:hypothetical protein